MSKLSTRESDDRVTTLCLLGEWDMANAAELRAAATAAISDGRDVVIDLLECEFIDSSVINALVNVQTLATDEGKECVLLVSPQAAAWRVLEVTGIVLRIPTFSSEADALVAIRAGAA
jgi:anti-anti-sigma factor